MILFDRARLGATLTAPFLDQTFPTRTQLSPMPEVQVKKGEPVDRALKRLKTKLETEGILEEVRRLRSHETPKEKTRRKARAAAKRGKIRFRFTLNKPQDKNAEAAPAAS
jgi:small subunit ribosomal protein S21